MQFLKKITGNIFSQSANAAAVSPEILALQKNVQAVFSQNVSELQNFANSEVPDIIAKQTELLAQMNKLAQSVKIK